MDNTEYGLQLHKDFERRKASMSNKELENELKSLHFENPDTISDSLFDEIGFDEDKTYTVHL